MRPSTANFESSVDTRHDAERSIALRYRHAVRFAEADSDDEVFKECLARCSLREGVRLFSLLRHRGVDIEVLDETSAMHSGTLKSIDGCVTTAGCLQEGIDRICFETGGNTGAALAAYARSAALETFCFVPAENVARLDGATFAGETTHLIAVEDAGLVRAAAERFSGLFGIARMPRAGWRIAASRLLGCFLLEQILGGARFDLIVQTISAAFGPIGIYDVLEAHGIPLPRFLGVQQAANCAMFRAWQAGSADVATTPVQSTAALLSPAMYDSRPQKYGTFAQLSRLLERSHGGLTTVDHDEFHGVLSEHPVGRTLLDRLAQCGVEIATRDGEILEKTGLVALVAALRQIDAGAIERGSRILCCLTSGAGRPGVPAEADFHIRDLASLDGVSPGRWFTAERHA